MPPLPPLVLVPELAPDEETAPATFCVPGGVPVPLPVPQPSAAIHAALVNDTRREPKRTPRRGPIGEVMLIFSYHSESDAATSHAHENARSTGSGAGRKMERLFPILSLNGERRQVG